MARGAIGGDLDQVLLVTDDLVGAIPGAVRFFKKPHPFRKGSTPCVTVALLALSAVVPYSTPFDCLPILPDSELPESPRDATGIYTIPS